MQANCEGRHNIGWVDDDHCCPTPRVIVFFCACFFFFSGPAQSFVSLPCICVCELEGYHPRKDFFLACAELCASWGKGEQFGDKGTVRYISQTTGIVLIPRSPVSTGDPSLRGICSLTKCCRRSSRLRWRHATGRSQAYHPVDDRK